jgi:uncharacterized protein (TIGR02594 family)
MTEFFTGIPWLVVLLVFVGMAILQWRSLSNQQATASLLHDLAKLLAQLLAQAQPVPAAVAERVAIPAPPPPIKPAPAPPPPVAPKPAGPFAGAPPWFEWSLHEIGFHETGNNQGIERYIGLAHCGALGDPWCAIFVNAALESSGIRGTRSASAQSFRSHPDFVQLAGPALGAIAIFWRGARDSGLGHAGEYRGENETHVWTLGGNENDMVQVEALPKDSATFGLIGYWWPKSVPLPAIGAVLMPSGSPTSIQNPPSDAAVPALPAPASPSGRQGDITATMFGGQQSAYGGPIDDNAMGCALPFRFSGERPKVRVTGKRSGVAVDCAIVDVGPWNTNDPYWQSGARPQAESGTDTRGRHTNRAGIDLTFAAAKALQVDGKGLVDWEFIESPLATPVKVI